MNRCEVVGVRNLADEAGIPCTRAASEQCCDCGINICESHMQLASSSSAHATAKECIPPLVAAGA